MQRYAIYFTPDPGSSLNAFGSGVIGYDANSSRRIPFLENGSLPRLPWEDLTESARRYGFHATLKAPFSLAAGTSRTDLLAAVRRLAAGLQPVDAGILSLSCDDGFFALRPAPECHPCLSRLAQTCVETLDAFRAPLSAADRARRRPEALSESQRNNLDRWGYPYVGDDFAFHMTLTGPIPGPLRETVRETLAKLYACSKTAVTIDALTVCAQPSAQQRFSVLQRIPIG